MKKLTLCFLLTFTFLLVKSQTAHKVPYYKWSDPSSYQLGPAPVITGNGALTDSLLSIFEVRSVYEYNDEYFLINSWADYYLWYTNKYWFHFNMPELYQYYYNSDDDWGMVNFVANNFKGNYYPSKIIVTTEDNKPLFNQWTEKRLIASNKIDVDKYAKKLSKQYKRHASNKVSSKSSNPANAGGSRTVMINASNQRRTTTNQTATKSATRTGTISSKTRTGSTSRNSGFQNPTSSGSRTNSSTSNTSGTTILKK